MKEKTEPTEELTSLPIARNEYDTAMDIKYLNFSSEITSMKLSDRVSDFLSLVISILKVKH